MMIRRERNKKYIQKFACRTSRKITCYIDVYIGGQ